MTFTLHRIWLTEEYYGHGHNRILPFINITATSTESENLLGKYFPLALSRRDKQDWSKDIGVFFTHLGIGTKTVKIPVTHKRTVYEGIVVKGVRKNAGIGWTLGNFSGTLNLIWKPTFIQPTTLQGKLIQFQADLSNSREDRKAVGQIKEELQRGDLTVQQAQTQFNNIISMPDTISKEDIERLADPVITTKKYYTWTKFTVVLMRGLVFPSKQVFKQLDLTDQQVNTLENQGFTVLEATFVLSSSPLVQGIDALNKIADRNTGIKEIIVG